MTFNEYILDWWQNFIGEAANDTCDELMRKWIDKKESRSDHIFEPAPNSREWLLSNVTDSDEIYRAYFGYGSGKAHKDIPNTDLLLTEMFTQAVQWPDGSQASLPSFAGDFVSDMAYHAAGYTMSDSFFEDLCKNGCISGIIGLLVYNSDCKQLYCDHIDDMEDFKQQLEESLGEPITNRHKLPHYTFMCWLCYEELAHAIAENLWPGKF